MTALLVSNRGEKSFSSVTKNTSTVIKAALDRISGVSETSASSRAESHSCVLGSGSNAAGG